MQEIKTIFLNDKNYPRLLKKLKDAPKTLYYRGKFLAKEDCFGVVGARLCSAYGKQAALEIAGGLADAGLTVVSGLAPGIDTHAHLAAVERSKRTIAVLGTGPDDKSIYPKDNINLAQKIIETGGCLISEYPPGTHGNKLTFPKRNRIISGLSLGVVVVEAKSKSGALITADYAKKQKRKIFALPGSVYALNSKGCHNLIKRGAKLAENAADILEELKLSPAFTKASAAKPASVNKEENLILGALKEGALDTEKIIETTKLKAPLVASTLAILELKGIVRNLGENIYAISNR